MIKRYLTLYSLFLFCLHAFSQNTFFSENFTGGFPSGWISVKRQGNNLPSSNWRWTSTGPQGSYATDDLASTTASGGWMIFDSDLNCNHPHGQDVWLISPPIDASEKEIVWLVFETYYRSFNDRPAIRIGTNTNELDNWVNVEVFPGIVANQFGGAVEGDMTLNPQVIYEDISAHAAGLPNLRIAFQFLSTAATNNGADLTGCAYNWQIDDVKLTDYDPRPNSDIRINSFYAVAPNAITPSSQIEPMGFLADIRNSGKLVQPATTLHITIENSAGAIIYQDSLLFGAIAPDSIVQNVFFQSEFTPPPVPDVYTATYFASPTLEDDVPVNNSRSFIFEISDTLFAKQTGADLMTTADLELDYTFGNVFYVPNGSNLYARYLSFGVGNAPQLAGKTVSTFLYRWYGDENNDFMANPDEYGGGPVGANAYTFTGAEGNNLITVPVDFENVNGIALESNAYYIAAVQYQTNDSQQLNVLASNEYDYHAVYLYNDSMMHPQYAAVIDVGNTGLLDWTGFGLDFVPAVRLSIGPLTAAAEQVLPKGSASIFPNPVSAKATLSLHLPQLSEQVQLQLFDGKGTLQWQRDMYHIQEASIPLHFDQLASGMYWLRIRTPSGMLTLSVAVQ